jgi:hypothetical protein
MEPGPGIGDGDFEIFGKVAVAIEPSKGALER